MVRIRLVAVVVALVATTVSAFVVVRPAAAMGPAGCTWLPLPLPLPDNASQGRVTAGDGDWLAGTAGSEEPNDPDEGVLWHRGRLHALGLAFGLDTALHAVNPAGVAVGRVIGADGLPHAIRHGEGGYEYLPETDGSSTALDINPTGDIVGFDGLRRLVVWPATGGPARDLLLPAGAAPYRTAAIDDDGTVVAWAGRPDTTDTLRLRGYLWHPNGIRTTLPPGDVHDIRHGRVVGTTEPPHATTWSSDGRATTLAGGDVAVAVNRDGLVVGTTGTGESLLWVAALAPQQLPPPRGHHPGAVTAINDTEVAGYSFPPDRDDGVPVRWRCQ